MYLFAYFQILIVKLDIIKQKKSDSYLNYLILQLIDSVGKDGFEPPKA